MAHLPNPNATLTSPTVRKAGTYCLVTYGDPYRPGSYCCDAYRNGKIIAYGNGAATLWAAIREARRNVRNARKAGGL